MVISEHGGPRTWTTRGRHDVYWLGSGELTLGAVPNLGGRLLAIRKAGHELLWRNAELLTDELQPVTGHEPAPHRGVLGDWRNYGGDKTWPAPQGWSSVSEWAGPPDPVLDSGAYTANVVATSDLVTLTMTSAPDSRTGLQLTRALMLADDSGFGLRLTARNTSDHDVTWSLWNVTQLAGGATVEIAVDEAFTKPVELVDGTGVPSWVRTDRGSVEIGPQDVVGKLGFPHATGRMSYHYDTACVSWTFDIDGAAPYPDGGSRAEVWMEHPQPAPLDSLDGLDPPDRIVECEVLSPLRTLAPGDTMTLAVNVSVQNATDRGEDSTCSTK